jgi:hypothetical protein
MAYADRWIQTCIFSTVVYFTGAIELSKLFGYIELQYRTNPTIIKSLVYTIRQSQQMSAGILRYVHLTRKEIAYVINPF